MDRVLDLNVTFQYFRVKMWENTEIRRDPQLIRKRKRALIFQRLG